MRYFSNGLSMCTASLYEFLALRVNPTSPLPPIAARCRSSPHVAALRRPSPPVAARRCPSPPVAARGRPSPPVAARGRPSPPVAIRRFYFVFIFAGVGSKFLSMLRSLLFLF